jgi:hypothetical protein
VGFEELSIPPHTGLPACCTQITPPEIGPGETAVFNIAAGLWSLIEDHRGKTVYSTASGEPIEISALGELPEGVTTKAPAANIKNGMAITGLTTRKLNTRLK